MNDDYQTIKVGDLVLIKKDDEYVGTEIVWNENVLNRSGATFILDMLQNMFTKTGWVTQTLLRAPENKQEAEVDAQIEESTDQSGDADDTSAKKSRRKISAKT